MKEEALNSSLKSSINDIIHSISPSVECSHVQAKVLTKARQDLRVFRVCEVNKVAQGKRKPHLSRT